MTPVLASAASDQILALHGWLALALVFLLPALQAALFLGFAIPGELAILLGGVLAAQGRVPLAGALLAAVLGAVVGDTAGYLIGRRWGRSLLAATVGRLVPGDRLRGAELFLRRHGGLAVFFGRFTAPLRPLIPGLSGMSRMSPWAFSVFNVVGALVWAGGWTLLGYLAGAGWQGAHAAAGRAAGFGLSLGLALFAAWRLGRGRAQGDPASGGSAGGPPPPAVWEVGLLGFATLLAAAAFAGLTLDVVAGRGLAQLDPAVWAWAVEQRTPAASAAFEAVTWLGSSPVLALFVVLTGVWYGRRRGDWRVGIRLVVALAGIIVLYVAVKALTGRVRPPQEARLTLELGLAYPSGHAAQSLVGYGLLAGLFARGRGRAAQVGLWLLACLLVAGVGFSRIYLGVHWLSDVVGGYVLAVVWLLGLATAAVLARRRAPG